VRWRPLPISAIRSPNPVLDDPVGQLDRDIEIFGILKLRPVENQIRPLLRWRQIAPREIVNVARRAKLWHFT
jgi:hypothetical protein